MLSCLVRSVLSGLIGPLGRERVAGVNGFLCCGGTDGLTGPDRNAVGRKEVDIPE